MLPFRLASSCSPPLTDLVAFLKISASPYLCARSSQESALVGSSQGTALRKRALARSHLLPRASHVHWLPMWGTSCPLYAPASSNSPMTRHSTCAAHGRRTRVAVPVVHTCDAWPADVLDYLYGIFWRTFLIEASVFRRLDCGVELSFKHPPGWDESMAGGYVLVNVPWIAKGEWHAFSRFESSKESYSSICIYNQKDPQAWSCRLHRELGHAPSHRSVWVSRRACSPHPRVRLTRSHCLTTAPTA